MGTTSYIPIRFQAYSTEGPMYGTIKRKPVAGETAASIGETISIVKWR